MGIKSIKSVENNLQPDPIFELQGMVKVRKEPLSREYRLLKKIGAGTYGEVFEAVHEQTGNRRAVKKINTLKFPRAKTMILSEVSLLKSLVPCGALRTTRASSRSTRCSRRRSSSTSSLSTARANSSSTSSSTATTSPRTRPASSSTRSSRPSAPCTPTASCTATSSPKTSCTTPRPSPSRSSTSAAASSSTPPTSSPANASAP